MTEAFIIIVSSVLGSSLLSAILNVYKEQRARRRDLYARGLYLISEREELYYMILRRGSSKEKGNSLVEKMHRNQMNIQEHHRLLQVDSYWMGESYGRLISEFRKSSEQKFRDAWSEPLNKRYDSVPKERRICNSENLDEYAKDCRRRLNPLRSALNTLTRWR